MILDNKRVDAAEKLLEEVNCIAQNPRVISSVPAIGLLLNFLKEVGLEIEDPTDCQGIFGKDPKCPYFSSFSKREADKNSILLYPLFLSDARIDKVCEYYTKAVRCAGYGPNNNTIIVNMDAPETLRMLAVSFLHELGHAQAAHCEGRTFKEQSRPDEQRLYEETAVWTMEYKLVIALGGEEFLRAITSLVEKIFYYWKKKRVPSQKIWEGKGAALDLCFGVSPAPDAEKERDGTFLTYCQLMAADIFFPNGQRIAAKMEIMRVFTGYQGKDALLKSFTG
jgi:hypothetical protein